MNLLGENGISTICVPKEGPKDVHVTKTIYTSTKAVGIFQKRSGNYLVQARVDKGGASGMVEARKLYSTIRDEVTIITKMDSKPRVALAYKDPGQQIIHLEIPRGEIREQQTRMMLKLYNQEKKKRLERKNLISFAAVGNYGP